MPRFQLVSNHPGQTLLHIMNSNKLSRREVARALGVPVMRISELCSGKRKITANSAIRLGEYLNTGAEFWMTLQMRYELSEMERSGQVEKIKKEIASYKK